MTETEKDYNGSTVILNKLGTLLGEDSIPVSAAIRIMLEAQEHQIKVTHAAKMETREKIKKLEDELKDIQDHGAKINPKSAFIYASLFWGLDRSGLFDSVVHFVIKNFDLLLKMLPF